MTRHLAALTALALALPGVALAQDDALARAAEVYRLAAWPAPGPARAGVAPAAVGAPGWVVPGWVVDGQTVHPARGEATVRLVQPETKAEVALSARVLELPAAARAALLRRLAAVQRPLEPVAGVGEVAFGGAVDGRLVLLHAVRGNVLVEVRATEGRERVPAEALRSIALALDALVMAAPPVEPGQAAGPRLLGVRVAPARAGAPARVALDLDPAGPPAAFVLFESQDDVSVVEVDGGWELIAAAPGTVRLTVWAASKLLWPTRAEVTVEVR